MQKIIALAAALALGACASRPPLTTASGKPDVTMNGVDLSCAAHLLANAAVTKGWRVTPSMQSQVVVETEAAPGLAAALLNTPSGPPRLRVVFTFLRQRGAVRVVADASTITGSGGYETIRPRTMSAVDQSALEEFQSAAVELCRR